MRVERHGAEAVDDVHRLATLITLKVRVDPAFVPQDGVYDDARVGLGHWHSARILAFRD
jgi:hypothetical protein